MKQTIEKIGPTNYS